MSRIDVTPTAQAGSGPEPREPQARASRAAAAWMAVIAIV